MKLITNEYEYLATIECACCRESHTVKLTRDDHLGTLWFDFDDSPYSFPESLKRRADLFLRAYDYVGTVTEFGVLATRKQLRELADVLGSEFTAGKPQERKKVHKTQRRWFYGANFSSKFKSLFVPDVVEYDLFDVFSRQELVVSYDEDVDVYTIGYRFADEDQARATRGFSSKEFWNGKYDVGISFDDASDLLATLRVELGV